MPQPLDRLDGLVGEVPHELRRGQRTGQRVRLAAPRRHVIDRSRGFARGAQRPRELAWIGNGSTARPSRSAVSVSRVRMARAGLPVKARVTVVSSPSMLATAFLCSALAPLSGAHDERGPELRDKGIAIGDGSPRPTASRPARDRSHGALLPRGGA